MTPTKMARRSDSLYMDTKNMHRRQLCDMVAHRENDIEDLRDEAYGLRCDIGRLENENARLRELAAGIGYLLFPLDVDYCATCPRDSINHPCPVHTIGGGECLYKTDLREMGVEV